MNKILFVAVLALSASACKKEAAAPAVDPAKAGVAAEAKARPVATEGRRVDVLVSREGYKPARVDVKAGEQVPLVFTRVEDTECGAEVMIPSLNVKKPLPLNEPVAIAFKQDTAGEVGFACGMDMMKGSVV